MIATKGFLDRIRKEEGLDISPELEEYFLVEYGREPCPFEYTEHGLRKALASISAELKEGGHGIPSYKERYIELLRSNDEMARAFFELSLRCRDGAGGLPAGLDFFGLSDIAWE